MKTIHSAGGSFIAIRKDRSMSWLGSIGKSFIGTSGRFSTDYEAAEHVTSGEESPASTIGFLEGVDSNGVLIAMPFETAIVRRQPDAIHIAQVEYGDPDWNFESLRLNDFNNSKILDCKSFMTECGMYVLFDAAYAGSAVGDDYLDFFLDKGKYTFSYSKLEPNHSTGLLLYVLKKLI